MKQQRDADMVALFNEGVSIPEIAARFYIGLLYCKNILHQHGCKVTLRSLNVIPQRNEEIAQLFKQGVSIKDIATKFYLQQGTVMQVLYKQDVSLKTNRSQRRTFERNLAICEEYSAGVNTPLLADKYHISRERVCQILRRANLIELRDERRKLAKAEVKASINAEKAAFKNKIAEAIELVKQGFSVNEAGRRVGISSSGILQHYTKGLSLHGRWRDNSARKARFLELRAEGNTIRSIVKIMRDEGERIHPSWIARHIDSVQPHGTLLKPKPEHGLHLDEYPS